MKKHFIGLFVCLLVHFCVQAQFTDYAILADQKAPRTNGGAPASVPAWTDRVLNTVVSSAGTSIALLTPSATNTSIKLEKGTYYVRASAPSYGGNTTKDSPSKIVIRDSLNKILVIGTTEYVNHDRYVQTRSFLEGVIIMERPGIIKLSQWFQTVANNAPFTMGIAASSSGTPEIFSELFITRIK